MDFLIGKIYSYKNELGKILTTDDEYIFNVNDLENNTIKEGDIVQFRPEEVNGLNRAFFISKINNKEDIDNNKVKENNNEK